jgi:hypothetical protein
MSSITRIGKCKGCDRPRKLDDGVCDGCLTAPARGRVWAERAHRCRTDPEFAKQVYDSISTQTGKVIFMTMFGVPIGSTAPEEFPAPTGTYPPQPRGLHLVKG